MLILLPSLDFNGDQTFVLMTVPDRTQLGPEASIVGPLDDVSQYRFADGTSAPTPAERVVALAQDLRPPREIALLRLLLSFTYRATYPQKQAAVLRASTALGSEATVDEIYDRAIIGLR